MLISAFAETSYSTSTFGEEISCFSLLNNFSWLAVHIQVFLKLSSSLIGLEIWDIAIWGEFAHLVHHPHESSKLCDGGWWFYT